MAGGQIKVMVSGAFDILHGGHVQFLRDARALGDHLTVCIPSDIVVHEYKARKPYLTAQHKQLIISEFNCVDEVLIGDDMPPELNFVSVMKKVKPDILAVTEDDRFSNLKRQLCEENGARYVQLPKSPVVDGTCATELRAKITAPVKVPARVDFAGGWLDVPNIAVNGSWRRPGYIVNCAITPMMSLNEPFYKPGGGVGGSAAWALLNGKPPLQSELDMGVGWQDPAIIQETGLCIWRAGERPSLGLKKPGNLVEGRMALDWSGAPHVTKDIITRPRNYNAIAGAGRQAGRAVYEYNYDYLCDAVKMSYAAQVDEGMTEIGKIDGERAHKYCGAGWGGYILRLFRTAELRDAAVANFPDMIKIEPYLREWQ